MKDILIAWFNRPAATIEQREFALKELVIRAMVLIVAGGFFSFVYSVTHVEQPMLGMAPIDKQYLQNIKEIMLMCIGSLGTIAAQSTYKAAKEYAASIVAAAEPKPDEPEAQP